MPVLAELRGHPRGCEAARRRGTKTLAIKLGPFNINVNAVAPGFIETAMTQATADRIGIPFDGGPTVEVYRTTPKRVGHDALPVDEVHRFGVLADLGVPAADGGVMGSREGD